jgi:hypothetical protein
VGVVDLRTNTARSRLAEYLVAVALNVHHRPRVEWDSHDVTARDGTRVEVKSSAYLQAWDQARLSRISFGGLRARTWSPQAGYAADVTYNADVYVFALQTAVTHETYDALNLDQWRFWVASAVTIVETGQDQVSPSRVQALCGTTSSTASWLRPSRRRPGRSRTPPASDPQTRAVRPATLTAPLTATGTTNDACSRIGVWTSLQFADLLGLAGTRWERQKIGCQGEQPARRQAQGMSAPARTARCGGRCSPTQALRWR